MPDAGASILIIDDEPPLLRMMSLYLTRVGYRVTVAGSAFKAREALAAAPARFVAAVLDATVPGTTLMELGAEILNSAGGIRLLVASGYPIDIAGLEAVAPGRVSFLHKPFSPEMLADALRRLLGEEEGV